jgi:peptide/nickel transport system substrate-binding protein
MVLDREGSQVESRLVRMRWLGPRGPLLSTLAVAVAGFLTACGGAGEQAGSEPQQAATTGAADQGTSGGTLRVALVGGALSRTGEPAGEAHSALDPQVTYDYVAWELFRCCLLRTLMSYNGKPTGEGGAEPQPDLAAELPTVSPDGLTWTFRLTPGLRYAPPLEDTEIVAADVVRAVERTLRIGSYALYYSPLIEGSEAFAAGEADSISGLETPDDHTVVVHLTEPAGDLGHRFSLAATAPIPAAAADGHDYDFGRFLAASGPYMLAGYEQDRSLTLVRNPSWSAATDGLRAAYADRIELASAVDEETAYADVENGNLDIVLDGPPPPDLVERYRGDPALEPRLVVIPQDVLIFAAMNLAQPPFDDVHVRRAANLAVDKLGMLEPFGAGAARLASHAAPDSLEGNLLLEYDPYGQNGQGGDLAAARAEMARSRYDSDGDGRCDQPVCSGIRTIGLVQPGILPQEVPGLLERDLGQIGIELEVEGFPAEEGYAALEAHADRHALVVNAGWGKDFPNGSGWFSPVLDGDDPRANPSLVGADPDQLAEWGYPVTSVPGVDDEIAECKRLVGGAQTQCWATLDQLVMEQIVPWIPYALRNEARIVSDRVAGLEIDQLTSLPSLDRVALLPAGP